MHSVHFTSRSVGIHCLIKFNGYMLEMLENERQAAEAEEQV